MVVALWMVGTERMESPLLLLGHFADGVGAVDQETLRGWVEPVAMVGFLAAVVALVPVARLPLGVRGAEGRMVESLWFPFFDL